MFHYYIKDNKFDLCFWPKSLTFSPLWPFSPRIPWAPCECHKIFWFSVIQSVKYYCAESYTRV